MVKIKTTKVKKYRAVIEPTGMEGVSRERKREKFSLGCLNKMGQEGGRK